MDSGDTNVSEARPGKVSKRLSPGNLYVRAIAATLVFLILVAVIGVLTGRIAITLNPSAKATVVYSVCDPQDTTKFNEIFANDGAGDLINGINSRPGSDNDINCAFMSYLHYYNERQYSKAKPFADRVMKLVDEGQSIDSNNAFLQNTISIKHNIGAVSSLKDGASEDGFDDED